METILEVRHSSRQHSIISAAYGVEWQIGRFELDSGLIHVPRLTGMFDPVESYIVADFHGSSRLAIIRTASQMLSLGGVAVSDLEVFHFNKDKRNFEDFAQADGGGTFWFARDLATMLGYEDYSAYQRAINKVPRACLTLEISVGENFVQTGREIGG